MPVSIPHPSWPHPSWVAAGLALLIIGILLIRWAARNNMASVIADATTDAVIGKLRKGGTLEVPAEVKARYDDVMAAGTHVGRAKKLAGYTFRHAMSQLAGTVGFILAIVGVMAALLGVFYA